MSNDFFELYDLKVETIGKPEDFVCKHKLGEYFELSGEMLNFSKFNKFSLYALSAILPLLPAKQRDTSPNDWMTTDAEVACPDPNCKARFKISRTKKTIFSHGETTIVPLNKNQNE